MEQLKPPGALNLEGNLAENFKEWIQSFELYLTATGIEEFTQQVSLEYQRWLAERFIIA
jgi:hypothetical protein